MAAENGCLTVTAQNVTDGNVTVTPTATPIYGEARVTTVKASTGIRAQLGAPDEVKVQPLKAEVSGSNLVITLVGVKANDVICWTSYDS